MAHDSHQQSESSIEDCYYFEFGEANNQIQRENSECPTFLNALNFVVDDDFVHIQLLKDLLIIITTDSSRNRSSTNICTTIIINFNMSYIY